MTSISAMASRRAGNTAAVNAILCLKTGIAYTDEFMADLNGCDIENAPKAEIPSTARYVCLGTLPNIDGHVVFLDWRKAFDWMMAQVPGTSVTTYKVVHPRH